LETAQRLGIASDILGKKFQSDEPAKLQVFGFVHHAHAAATSCSTMR